MAFTKLTRDMNIIQKLDDEPNDVGGLTAAELKAKFDEPANAVKDWINNTFIPEAEETLRLAQLESVPKHASRHALGGADPVTPSMIGALATDGSNTMTGAVRVLDGYTRDKTSELFRWENITILRHWLDEDGHCYSLLITPEHGGLLYQEQDGTNKPNYNILHSGNKPSGSYTGNGDATARTIEIGGIGNVVAIMGPHGICIASVAGAIGAVGGSAAVGFGAETFRFASGSITMTSSHELINESGSTYYYQVL